MSTVHHQHPMDIDPSLRAHAHHRVADDDYDTLASTAQQKTPRPRAPGRPQALVLGPRPRRRPAAPAPLSNTTLVANALSANLQNGTNLEPSQILQLLRSLPAVVSQLEGNGHLAKSASGDQPADRRTPSTESQSTSHQQLSHASTSNARIGHSPHGADNDRSPPRNYYSVGRESGQSGDDGSPSGPSRTQVRKRRGDTDIDDWTRQRKDNHKEVERRRRGTINEGINELARIVPNSTGGEKAKGAVLSRAVGYIHQLKENEARNIEKWTLEKLLMDQAMGDLQTQLEEMRRRYEEERRRAEEYRRELDELRGGPGSSEEHAQTGSKRPRVE
ncbi:hypothetical protein BOTBODRAFT_59007 [Botryobasidium botryosum FD-172 SS1]|uniref:BHLH domain-containing protein n=1 Tax=Botryobasidium botryosum (strain FD-172 SS1) TaxID=930990 RepID=A0A067MAR7_BOTB1|nr:hypothetical protein BOTBODRAFT_59007 [Botryobasidium botryosum FD-172 SS1]